MFPVLRNCKCRENCSIADIELLEDVVKVDFDRTIGNAQETPNLLVRQPLRYKSYDLPLPVGQLRRSLFLTGVRLPTALATCARRPRCRSLAFRNLPQGRDQHLRLSIPREDEAGAARGQRLQRLIAGLFSEENDPGTLASGVCDSQNVRSTYTGHCNIDQCNVGHQKSDRPNAACSIAASSHDRKIALRRKDAADPLQDDRVPIRDDDSDAAHASPAYP